MAFIKISKDFSDRPGARYKTDGSNSGELFREEHLEKFFTEASLMNEDITIDFDHTEGYATSFLEEAFGGLQRKFKDIDIVKRFKFISTQEESLINEVKQYINDAK
ncbi:MAG: STAS-like domain-containing protein [Bacteriovoracaceae bacterium]|jgi:hypothetical protein|nr:STAS-like domain-containing protein [Bacteriovoracaceae bacterium]